MTWIYLSVLCACLVYWYLIKPYKYWTDRGVPQKTPIPPLGHNAGLLFRTMSFAGMVQYVYNMFPNRRYSGFYQFLLPSFLLRDPELIKQIGIKAFDHFMDHKSLFPKDSEPLMGKNLFALKGEKWRHMRTTLSPCFTSHKMKAMFILMSHCAENCMQHFLKKGKETVTVDMKDVMSKYANDVIAATAFGVKCDSLEEPKNEFYLMVKETTDFSGSWRNIKLMFIMMIPKVARILGFKIFSERVNKFFTNLVKETMRVREDQKIIRPDMIHLLMEAKKGKLKAEESANVIDTGFATVEEHMTAAVDQKNGELTVVDITAQAMNFFFAGFDSVSTLMCFMSHELAVNPHIQERLRQEVDDAMEEYNGNVTYEGLMKMKYMDMVISESLRKWPTTVGVDRLCVKPYTIEPVTPEEKPVHLQVGDVLFIPIIAIQNDEQYFPNPERFDPERFSDENKSSIIPYTYIPFGVGPRNCIGSRFVLMEVKIIFFYMLAKFELVVVEKTQVPLKISKVQMLHTAEKGFWLGMKPRGTN